MISQFKQAALKGRTEGEGQKEHQAVNTEYVRVHFFLDIAVKQGNQPQGEQCGCAAAASKAMMKALKDYPAPRAAL